jgi:hypothetical protein
MASFAPRRIDPPRHGEDLSAVFVGEISRDECAAGQIGLDHDGAQSHAGHDAVADREGLFVPGAVEWELGYQCAIFQYTVEELLILARPTNIDACPKHGNRPALAA